MASITLKSIPDELHAQLKTEAEANFRSMAQEVLARVQRSFDLDDRFTAAQVNQLIAHAIASGPESPLTSADLEGARQEARKRFAAKRKAAAA